MLKGRRAAPFAGEVSLTLLRCLLLTALAFFAIVIHPLHQGLWRARPVSDPRRPTACSLENRRPNAYRHFAPHLRVPGAEG